MIPVKFTKAVIPSGNNSVYEIVNKTLTAILILFGSLAMAQPPGGPGGAMGDGIWVRNAAYGELETFDSCNGHQPGTGMYHHHINPVCLRAQLNDNVVLVSAGRLGKQYAEKATGWTHSPILGWAYDGYPVYGPYGYSNPMDPKSPIKRVQPSFQLRTITQRQTLPAWILPYLPKESQTLISSQYGPDVSASYPLGRYVDDYDYVAGSGDLDQYNGRFAVTPDYPNGTYAYYVTITPDGSAPVFPYIINLQYYGTAAGGNSPAVASDAADYFNNGQLQQAASTDPQLATWYTKGSQQNAEAITGFDPSAGPSTTWPTNKPAGVMVSGGQATPALADVQRVRSDAANVWVNSNNLPSYIIGPWFEATMTGGVFMNFPAASAQQAKFPRSPSPASTKTASGMGPVGMWVNGVAIFNTLDGGSYSNSAGTDQGGGSPSPRARHVSAASYEDGPLAAGSLAIAYPEFAATLAASTASASSTPWPTSLGGATVTLTDSSGAQLPAGILYASPTQVNYQVPATAAAGPGKITITSSGTSVTGTVNIAATYPGIFKQTADGLAAAQILRIHNGQQAIEAVTAAPIAMGGDQLYLLLYGTGIGTASVTATIGGTNASVQYSGAQGTYPGLDQINLQIPAALAGAGKVTVSILAAGRASNPVYLILQ
jgi:uncharacterized protein (TIGR03437 family)